MNLNARQRLFRRVAFALLVACGTAAPFIAVAGPSVSITSFTSGTTIKSADVNANFNAIAQAIGNTNGAGQLLSLDNSSNLNLPSGSTVACSKLASPFGSPGITINPNTGAGGTLKVSADTTVSGTVFLNGISATTSSGTIAVAGGLQVSGNITTASGTVTAAALTISGVSTSSVNGNLGVGGNLAANAITTGGLSPSSGALGVNGNLAVTGSITATGNLTATGTKSFIQPHPTDASKVIVYVCLEGGEAGVYCRGSAQLRAGRATIQLPDHFALVAAEKGLTAQVTATGD